MPLTFDFPWRSSRPTRAPTPARPTSTPTGTQPWPRCARSIRRSSSSRAEFQAPFAECFDLYFTGVGGARVHAKLLRPKQQAAPAPGRADVPRLHRQLGRLGRQAGLRGHGLHRRRARLPRPGRPLRGRRRRERQHPPRPHHPRPGRRAHGHPRSCSSARSSSTPRSWPRSSWTCPTWTRRAWAPPAAARAAG